MAGKVIDYSKWKDIDVSDDEDEAVNVKYIDKDSLARWKHQSRIEKMVERKQEEEKLIQEEKQLKIEKEQIDSVLKELEAKGEAESEELRKRKQKLKCAKEEWEKKMAEFKARSKSEPWNADTICRDGFNSSRISTSVPVSPVISQPPNLTQKTTSMTSIGNAEKSTAVQKPGTSSQVKTKVSPFPDSGLLAANESELLEFVARYKKMLTAMASLERWTDGRRFLLQHKDLCSELGIHALTLECLQHHLADNKKGVDVLAHLCIVLRYLIDAAAELKTEPRDSSLIEGLFDGLEKEQKEGDKSISNEVRLFKKSVLGRATEKIAKLEQQKRFGEKILTPEEVFPTLPKKMQECFENRDREKLKRVGEEMNLDVFRYHLERCTQSGLWNENETSENNEIADLGVANNTEAANSMKVLDSDKVTKSNEK